MGRGRRERASPKVDRSLALAASLSALLLATNFGAGSQAVRAQKVRAVPDGDAPAAEEVLRRAFANLYDCDTRAKIELVMRSRSGGERRRLFETASKRIENRLHSIGRLVAPARLRGLTVLTIEASNRSQDTLVYLPSLQRVRRVTTAQRGDSFLGSDLTYEDFERRRVEDLLVESMTVGRVGGERVYSVEARPRRGEIYERVAFLVAAADWALLETRYFKRRAEQPFRVVEAPRDRMLAADGHVLPTRITVRDSLRGTTTDVSIFDLEVNPDLDDRIFSVSTLEQERDLDRSAR